MLRETQPLEPAHRHAHTGLLPAACPASALICWALELGPAPLLPARPNVCPLGFGGQAF